LGVELSAFNLQLSFRSSCALTASVETVYQGSKTFSGCPRSDGDRFALGPRESRHRARELGDKGQFSGWEIGRYKFPLSSGVDFYNWLYLGALHQRPELLRELVSYDCFTDIEFNPQKSLACQARSAALARYCVLNEFGLLPYLRTVSSCHDTKASQGLSADAENLASESDIQLELQL
jgi:type I restriction enzyme M protein